MIGGQSGVDITKLLREPADERHFFLFGRSHRVQFSFYRLSDEFAEGKTEAVGDLTLQENLTSVWFQGRAMRDEPWTRESGWRDSKRGQDGTATWLT